MVNEVFVNECGYKSVATDAWDAVSQYYLMTVDGMPAGCARMVDPLAFPETAGELPRMGSRCRFAMEEDFPLDAVLPDATGFVEVGRFVVLPRFRGQCGLPLLIGTAVLYARHYGRKGNIGIGHPKVTKTYESLGWRPLGECFHSRTNRGPAQAMIIRTGDVASLWRERVEAMEERGVIAI